MKKNKMMRLASGLLVAVLLTTCAISGTFAKYTTQDSASDTARVAKWGVELQVAGNLYGDTYKNTIVANDATDLTVQAKDYATAKDFVVAPGTSVDEGFHISLTGTPEVDTRTIVKITAQNVFLKAGKYGLMMEVPAGTVDAENFGYLGDLYTKSDDGVSATFSKANSFDANTTSYYTLEDEVDTTTLNKYYPVVYAMAGDTTYDTGNTSKDTINEIAAEIAKKFNNNNAIAGTYNDTTNTTTYTVTSAVVDSNTDLDSHFHADDLKITWAWAFENGSSDTEKIMYNGADTILGNLMAGDALEGEVVIKNGDNYVVPTEYTDYCLDTSFSIDITVTQVD